MTFPELPQPPAVPCKVCGKMPDLIFINGLWTATSWREVGMNLMIVQRVTAPTLWGAVDLWNERNKA